MRSLGLTQRNPSDDGGHCQPRDRFLRSVPERLQRESTGGSSDSGQHRQVLNTNSIFDSKVLPKYRSVTMRGRSYMVPGVPYTMCVSSNEIIYFQAAPLQKSRTALRRSPMQLLNWNVAGSGSSAVQQLLMAPGDRPCQPNGRRALGNKLDIRKKYLRPFRRCFGYSSQ